MAQDTRFEPGRVVRILQGRGTGKYAVIIRIDENRTIWIADGKVRKFDNPKRKNPKHIFLESAIQEDIAELIHHNSRVPNKKIRLGLQQFINRINNEAQ